MFHKFNKYYLLFYMCFKKAASGIWVKYFIKMFRILNIFEKLFAFNNSNTKYALSD